MSAEALLNRLDKVRSNGRDKWMACCPVHGDKNASLSIKQTPDETVLIHCFAGCGAAEILQAIGLSFDDLFPKIASERRSRERRLISADDALLAIHVASLTVGVIASDMKKLGCIGESQIASLSNAIGTITMAVEAVHG